MQTTRWKCTMSARKALNTTGAYSRTIRVRVLQRGHKRFCVAATVKSFEKTTCRLTIARMLLVQVFHTITPNANRYCHFTQLWLFHVLYINHTELQMCECAISCTANYGSAGIPVIPYDISKLAISWNSSRHYRLHRFLIATGGAPTIFAHDHVWTDTHMGVRNFILQLSKPYTCEHNHWWYNFHKSMWK